MMEKVIPGALAALALVFSLGIGPVYAASPQGSRIASELKDTHAYKTYLKDEDIRVEERNGVVTLKGTVSDDSKKSLAEETASALPGVKKVNNRLEVRKDQPSRNSDAWITAKVKTALAFHKGVSMTDTKVETKDGVVILHGNAESEAQKKLTTEYVKDLDGVKEVRNEMTFEGPGMGRNGPMDGTTDNPVGSGYPAAGTGSLNAREGKIDDASITSSVKSALKMNRSDSLPSEIRTKDGVVTLKGKAGSAEEKDRISRRVSDIRGVQSVRNEMSIAEPGSAQGYPDRTLTGQKGVRPYPARPTGSAPQGDQQQGGTRQK